MPHPCPQSAFKHVLKYCVRKKMKVQYSRGRHSSLSAFLPIRNRKAFSWPTLPFLFGLTSLAIKRRIGSATPPCLRSLSTGIKDLAMRGMLNSAKSTRPLRLAYLVPALPVQLWHPLLQ
jgi:hypothetical protein